MNRVAVLFTSLGQLVGNFTNILKDTVPDLELTRIVDDGLIRDVKANGGINDNIKERSFLHIKSAVEAKADIVVIACSSIGELAEEANEKFDVPVIRIDSAMMDSALKIGTRVGVLASLGTTIKPTVGMLKEKAERAGKNITIIDRVAEGAYEALNGGNPELHDELIKKCALEIEKEVDVIILAQGSMAKLRQPLSEVLSVPVLSSPDTCAEALKEFFEKGRLL